MKWGLVEVVSLTFMIGIGSSPGEPRSSIMFLMSMERSATLRSVGEEESVSIAGEVAQ